MRIKLSTEEKYINTSLKYYYANIINVFYTHTCLHTFSYSCRFVHHFNSCAACFTVYRELWLLFSDANTKTVQSSYCDRLLRSLFPRCKYDHIRILLWSLSVHIYWSPNTCNTWPVMWEVLFWVWMKQTHNYSPSGDCLGDHTLNISRSLHAVEPD